MKGLMFNLLERLAQEAGCSDEAWSLVIEFAATERHLMGQLGEDHRTAFEVPTEAMIGCLTAGGRRAEDDDWRVLDATPAWLLERGSHDPIEELFVSGYDALPRAGGFQTHAFAPTETLVQRLEALEQVMDAEDEYDEDLLEIECELEEPEFDPEDPFGLFSPRSSGS